MNQRRAGSAVENTLRTLNKSEAQRILNLGHHRYQQSAYQQVATALGCSGPNLLYTHLTPSPLSSATLLADYVRHRILRNLEHVSSTVIRRTLDFASERHPAWQHCTSQAARKLQCQQVLERLEVREKMLLLRREFDGKCERLGRELEGIQEQIKKLRLVIQSLEEVVRGSLHPASLLQGGGVLLTPSEAAKLPSPLATVRGILVRIKGPRRGTRCMTWQKAAGRISINSVQFVTAEEAKVGLPSKLGIFGLTVRLVYGRRNCLVNARTPLPLLDQPNFTFIGLDRT